MSTLKMLLAAGAISVGALVSGQAKATVINATDFTDGTTTQTFGDLTAAAGGGTFAKKSLNGVTGVGITGSQDGVPGEINVGESIKFTTSGVDTLNSFTVAFLFPPNVFGDTVFEVSLLTVDGGLLGSGTLRVTGATTATWLGLAGTVSNLSPATTSGAGEFQVSGLGQNFSSLLFTTSDLQGNGTPPAASNSDYSLVSLDVPEPASLALLGVGLAGLGLYRRRRAG